jgi:hypothetical protein
MKWIIALMAKGVIIAIAVAITTQTSAAMSESDTLSSVNLSAQNENYNDRIGEKVGLSEAEPVLVQARPPRAKRTMWMMFDSGGKPTWALVMGGMMVVGAVILASSPDEEGDHNSNSMPVMMGVMGTGMLIYYFISDDVPRKAQTAWGDPPSASYALNLDLRRDAVQATGFWRW